MVAQLIVQGPSDPLRGSIPLPSDEPVLLARISLAALCQGPSTFALSGAQGETKVLLKALGLLGLQTELGSDQIVVSGQGLSGLSSPTGVLDLRGSVHVAALVLGLCVSRSFASELWVDDIVARLLLPVLGPSHPLSAAALDEQDGVSITCAAVDVQPEGLSIHQSGLFPWVKQAALLCGLRARTRTVVEETFSSVDHLERALVQARLPIEGHGSAVVLHPPRDDALQPTCYGHLGSLSLLAPVAAAAALIAGSTVTFREVSLNPSRSGFLNLLRLFGARCGITPHGDREGEPFGEVTVSALQARPLQLAGEMMGRLSDEALFCWALAAGAEQWSAFGDCVFQGRGADPRVAIRALSLARSAGLKVSGGDPSQAGQEALLCAGAGGTRALTFTTGGDGRLAQLATVWALLAAGTSTIDNVDCLRDCFPRWVGTLKALGAPLAIEQSP